MKKKLDGAGNRINERTDKVCTLNLWKPERTLCIGSSSIVGKREKQQDTIKRDTDFDFYSTGRAIVVLCDGMGGMNSGERASELCSSLVYDAFHSSVEFPSIPLFFRSVIQLADMEIGNMRTEEGTPLNGSGTTMVSVVIEGNDLYWASVGDSRIYIVRNDTISCVTNDHNYMMLLDEKVKRGELTRQEAESDPKKEALISFIGGGNVRYVDINNEAFKLVDGDCIVLCSDGLYKSVSDDEILSVVCRNGKASQLAAEDLTDLAQKKGNRFQDNTSVVVISYSDSM